MSKNDQLSSWATEACQRRRKDAKGMNCGPGRLGGAHYSILFYQLPDCTEYADRKTDSVGERFERRSYIPMSVI